MSHDLHSIPEALEGETIFLREELAKSRDPELRAKPAQAYLLGYGFWDQELKTWNRSHQRPVMTNPVSELIGITRNGTRIFVETATDPNKPRRRCTMAGMVGSDVAKLIKMAPNNATFRARLMAVLMELPPKEADTYEKVRDWVEFNFPKGVGLTKKVAPLDVSYEGSVTESGRCDYSRYQSIDGTARLERKEIEDIIDSHDDINEAVAAVHERIRTIAIEHGHRGTWRTDTSDHESSEGEEIDVNINYTSVEKYVREVAIEVIDDDDREGYGLE